MASPATAGQASLHNFRAGLATAELLQTTLEKSAAAESLHELAEGQLPALPDPLEIPL